MISRMTFSMAWFSIILVLSAQAYAAPPIQVAKHESKTGELATLSINFDPQYIVAARPSVVNVSLELADRTQRFANDMLILEQQKQFSNGQTVFFPVAQLTDNDTPRGNGCQSAENGKPAKSCSKKTSGSESGYDGIFTGKMNLFEPVTGAVYLRARGLEKNRHRLLVSSLFSLPVQLSCGPTANVLPVKVINGNGGLFQSEVVEFNVPAQGKAVLRIVNGASIGAPVGERVSKGKVSINGKQVLFVRKSDNVSELPIKLVQGVNRLQIENSHAKTEERLSASISACADRLKIKPVPDTQKADTALLAEAAVSGLGIPVENAKVKFELNGMGAGQEATASTSGSGVATASFVIPTAGTGLLKASLANAAPTLSDETPITAVTEPSIFLGQGKSDFRLNLQEESYTPFFLYYVNKDPVSRRIQFKQTVEPNSGGIILKTNNLPADGFVTLGPNIFSIDETVKGLNPGIYTVNSTATIEETGETTSSTLKVTVVDPAAPEPLVLGTPSADPPAVSPIGTVKVTFLSLVGGTSTPPAVLALDEVDTDGKLLDNDIAQLKDDGKGDDEKAGDLAYTGSVALNALEVGERKFRVRADYFGSTVVSSQVAFGVTPFPLEARPSDPSTLITDPNNGGQVFANEVVVEFLPDVTPDRIEAIAAAVGAQVVGAVPALHTYLLEITGNESFAGVQQVIYGLRAFSEVKDASPNEKPVPSSFPNDPGYSGVACPTTPASIPRQWYLDAIQAPEAWNVASGGNAEHAVAILDSGIFCNHEDLSGQCVSDDSAKDSHATEIAGIVAANTNNSSGIAGVAYGSKLYDYMVDSLFTLTQENIAARIDPKVRVVNISNTVSSSTGLKTAIDSIIDSGRLVVAASGNPTQPDCSLSDNNYPAKWGVGKQGLISIGGTDDKDQLAKFNGNCSNTVGVELYAPGKDMCTTQWINSASPVKYTVVNGTSFATALSSGAAAVLWASKPSLTPAQVEYRLKCSANSVNLGNAFGAGNRLNLLSAVTTKEVKINFKLDNADFRNIFGYYFKDSKEAHILLDNIDNIQDSLKGFQTKIFLSDQQFNNLEFFIIPAGNGSVPGSGTNISSDGRNIDNLSFFDPAKLPTTQRRLVVFEDSVDNKWRVKDVTNPNDVLILRGIHTPVLKADAFFSESQLNIDNANHVKNLSPTDYNNTSGNCKAINQITNNKSEFVACWEDLDTSVVGASDLDYDDAVFSIVTTDQSTVSTDQPCPTQAP